MRRAFGSARAFETFAALLGMAVCARPSVAQPANLREPEPPTSRAAPPEASLTGEQLYQRGCNSLAAGDADAAVSELIQAVSRRPERVDYALALGRAYVAAGRGEDAMHLLVNLTARWPDSVEAHVALAKRYAEAGDRAAVRAVLGRFEARLDAIGVGLLAAATIGEGQVSEREAILRRGLERFSASEALWLALIDVALERGQFALAIKRVSEARGHLGNAPSLFYRDARAYFETGEILGQARVLNRQGAKPGQFVGEWLVVELREEPDRYLCCPPKSALYAVRQALDGGCDEPGLHCLHARIWQRIGRPELGFAVLRAREVTLLREPSEEVLATFADLALASNELHDYLRYSRMLAKLHPDRTDDVLYRAYLAAADRCNQRGDDALHREFLARALDLRADDAERMLQLADALWRSGLSEEARQWYQRVLERSPAHHRRAEILERLGD